ncbi:MAG: two-component sensor histidine kinase [Rhodobacteraceae bacterium]|nr:two-component sensor histidine kinase [Paracoccaceae bacterium]
MANLNRFLESAKLPRPFEALFKGYRRFNRFLYRYMPKRLYTRALLIIIVPIVILQSVLAFVFMERHYELVSQRMSEAVVREVATLVYILENFPKKLAEEKVEHIARDVLGLSASILPLEPLPAPAPKPYFDVVDRGLSLAISERISKPFWIDTVGRSKYVEIRIQLEDSILRVFARRSQTFASNSHIFLVWMVSTSIVLIIIAMLFLRKQIGPIVSLANAAENFGKGRPLTNFRASGAQEVRRAAQAFIEMRKRIERQIEQRTTMLAGVSHDLRTILTRLRLQLALISETQEADAMRKDVDEMNHMLDAYLTFARGDGDEAVTDVDVELMIEELEEECEISGYHTTASYRGEPVVPLRRLAIKRALSNLVTNAAKFGKHIEITGYNESGWLTVNIDDDGPGIPLDQREVAFRAFQRLDQSRNQDVAGSGLGLAIARDIIRGHGGDVHLEDSPLGGLRARVRIPI